jgi:hypothetical protein
MGYGVVSCEGLEGLRPLEEEPAAVGGAPRLRFEGGFSADGGLRLEALGKGRDEVGACGGGRFEVGGRRFADGGLR